MSFCHHTKDDHLAVRAFIAGQPSRSALFLLQHDEPALFVFLLSSANYTRQFIALLLSCLSQKDYTSS